jgi:hypothetical protein
VASRGRHTRSNPHLPLATPEADLEAVRRKGKSSVKGVSIAEKGNTPSPSVKTPFSYSQLPSRTSSEVSRFLNFGSVPAEFSISWSSIRGRDPCHSPLRRFHYSSFDYYCCTERNTCTLRSLGLLSVFPVISCEDLFSCLTCSHSISSEFSSTQPNIPMASVNTPPNRMDAIVAARYAPLVLPHSYEPSPYWRLLEVYAQVHWGGRYNC